MLFEESEHEPDEYDPEAEFRDPDSDSLTIPEVSREESPSATGPEVSIPEVSTETDQLDAPSELLTHFWALVLVLNGAILAVALAVLFATFEGSTTRSVGLLGVGVVLFGFAYRRYRAYQTLDLHADDAEPDESGSAADTSSDSDSTHSDGDDTKLDSPQRDSEPID